MRPLVWLWESDTVWRGLLTELLEEAFTVRHCSGLSNVWEDLLVGVTGVLVADFTRVRGVGLPDQARLCSLSSLTPVLLLLDESPHARLAPGDVGSCNVLISPFDDLDRLLAAVRGLSQRAPPVGAHALSAF